jgi:hypothetical protein
MVESWEFSASKAARCLHTGQRSFMTLLGAEFWELLAFMFTFKLLSVSG